MKPLTIEELRALEAGDWVWVVDFESNKGKYRQITRVYKEMDDTQFEFTSSYRQKGRHCHACNYGTTWVAYKNKECVDGHLVELRKPIVQPTLNTYGGFYVIYDRVVEDTEWLETEEEAKQRAIDVYKGEQR